MTAAPCRVRVTGDRFHPRVPDGAVYVGRSAPYLKRSWYANPFTVKEFGREEAVRLYREYLLTTDLLDQAIAQLAGADLACRCKPDEACHADVLIELVNGSRARVEKERHAALVREEIKRLLYWIEVGSDRISNAVKSEYLTDEQHAELSEIFASWQEQLQQRQSEFGLDIRLPN